MKKIVSSTSLALLVAVSLSACVTGSKGMLIVPSPELKANGLKPGSQILSDNGGCIYADNERLINGAHECLVIDTFKADKVSKNPTLAVFVHGDGNANAWGDVIDSNLTYNDKYLNGDYVFVSIIRPGYKNWGGQSSGTKLRYGSYSYTESNITAIMTAIKNLIKVYNPKKVVAFGYSGGAVSLASGVGLFPEIPIDELNLIACACDLNSWGHKYGASISPMTVASNVKKNIVVTALTGTKDSNTYPSISKSYIDKLKSKGIDASFSYLEGAEHNNSHSHKDTINFIKSTLAIK